MNSVREVTAPLFEPVSLADVYRSLRLVPEGSPPTHPDDLLLESYIASARGDVENFTRRSLVQRTLLATFQALPMTDEAHAQLDRSRRIVTPRRLFLPMGPVSSIESVQYYDGENVLQTLDPSAYFLAEGDVPQLRVARPEASPTTFDRPDAVLVTYVAGYTPVGSPPNDQADYAANIPKTFKNAILLGVELLYNDHQEREITAIKNTWTSILTPLQATLAV